jgi:glycosyltransferase-like protein LARGE
VAVWRSAKPRAPTDITLVTQLSVDRLPMLRRQCESWGSVIAAAAHVWVDGKGLVAAPGGAALDGEPAAAAERAVAAAHAAAEAGAAGARCKLDLVLIREALPEGDAGGLYPVNALRNRALALAATELVLLLDADFVPAAGLSALIKGGEAYAALAAAAAARRATILPAFEPVVNGAAGIAAAERAVAGGHGVVAAMFAAGELRGFHTDGFEEGHTPTDFPRWMRGEGAPYAVEYQEGCVCSALSLLSCRMLWLYGSMRPFAPRAPTA